MKATNAAITLLAIDCFLLQLILLYSTASAQSVSAVKLGFTAGLDYNDAMAAVCQLAIKDVKDTGALSNNVAIE